MLRDVESLQTENKVTVLHLAHPTHLTGPEMPIENVNLVRIPYDVKNPLLVIRAARTIASMSRGSDIVHSMALPSLLPLTLARIQTPWVHTEHWSWLIRGSIADSARQRLQELFYKVVYNPLLRKPREVIAVSNVLANAIAESRPGHITVIPNHVHLVDPTSLDSAPKRPLAEQRPIKMLAIGSLLDGKGPIQAVETVAELKRRGISSSLRWAGLGPLEQVVRSTAERLGVAESIELLGFVDPSDIGALYLESDLFLLPTAYETFGIVIAEAVSHGIPVVASGNGGYEDFLPKNGSRVVTTRSATDLADAVVGLLSDQALMSPQDLAHHATKVFSDDARLSAYRAVYGRALQT